MFEPVPPAQMSYALPLNHAVPLIHVNSLSDKMFDCFKLKAFTDDKINVTEKTKFCFWKRRKHCKKIRKCWFPAFSSFPTVFSKGFLNRVVNSRKGLKKR